MEVEDLTLGIGFLDGSVSIFSDIDHLGSIDLVREPRPPVDGLGKGLEPTGKRGCRIARREGERLIATAGRRTDECAGVDIQPEKVGRQSDQVEVTIQNQWAIRSAGIQEGLRIITMIDGSEDAVIFKSKGLARGGYVLLRLLDGHIILRIIRQPHPGILASVCADSTDAESVCYQGMVDGLVEHLLGLLDGR